MVKGIAGRLGVTLVPIAMDEDGLDPDAPRYASQHTAARYGIAITPAAAFTIGAGHAPNAVRLALASPPVATLTAALRTLAMLARGVPDDAAMD